MGSAAEGQRAACSGRGSAKALADIDCTHPDLKDLFWIPFAYKSREGSFPQMKKECEDTEQTDGHREAGDAEETEAAPSTTLHPVIPETFGEEAGASDAHYERSESDEDVLEELFGDRRLELEEGLEFLQGPAGPRLTEVARSVGELSFVSTVGCATAARSVVVLESANMGGCVTIAKIARVEESVSTGESSTAARNAVLPSFVNMERSAMFVRSVAGTLFASTTVCGTSARSAQKGSDSVNTVASAIFAKTVGALVFVCTADNGNNAGSVVERASVNTAVIVMELDEAKEAIAKEKAEEKAKETVQKKEKEQGKDKEKAAKEVKPTGKGKKKAEKTVKVQWGKNKKGEEFQLEGDGEGDPSSGSGESRKAVEPEGLGTGQTAGVSVSLSHNGKGKSRRLSYTQTHLPTDPDSSTLFRRADVASAATALTRAIPHGRGGVRVRPSSPSGQTLSRGGGGRGPGGTAGAVCKHGRQRAECTDESCMNTCEHGRRRTRCKDCKEARSSHLVESHEIEEDEENRQKAGAGAGMSLDFGGLGGQEGSVFVKRERGGSVEEDVIFQKPAECSRKRPRETSGVEEEEEGGAGDEKGLSKTRSESGGGKKRADSDRDQEVREQTSTFQRVGSSSSLPDGKTDDAKQNQQFAKVSFRGCPRRYMGEEDSREDCEAPASSGGNRKGLEAECSISPHPGPDGFATSFASGFADLLEEMD
uniref:Uncharacterized protein n=1 Tax=Chromera velia CCMP2878 TaxID=1169474 RepID=A0A0G4I1B7_9ALVE|eukprot:Cvel_10112.t1-p1 / transcript=Cvel_10112.t1 / gene=Cvel_10112 / organism=Chromera_velia_CCMP2878 / gene_product=Zinc finger protein 345, putative / transcript_product=Zinc finger protein 345, putative / location=Cvel_scaffold602:63398-67012(+) / protein_length=707 / sequence_SO=supercontig / SO=protein_coding / is_pseudo=false